MFTQIWSSGRGIIISRGVDTDVFPCTLRALLQLMWNKRKSFNYIDGKLYLFK